MKPKRLKVNSTFASKKKRRVDEQTSENFEKNRRTSSTFPEIKTGGSTQSLDASGNSQDANICKRTEPRVSTRLAKKKILHGDSNEYIGNLQKTLKINERNISEIPGNVAGCSSQSLDANRNSEVANIDTINEPRVSTKLDNNIITIEDSDSSVSSTSSETETDEDNENNSNKINTEKCLRCKECLNNSEPIYYEAHPQNAVEECIALTNDDLKCSTAYTGGIVRPQINITCFSIFNQQGQLCAIESNFVENKIDLYMSGYLKTNSTKLNLIDDESVPAKEIGPILQWFIRPINDGKRNSIILSTEYAEYILLNPSDQYKPLMDGLYEKIWISNVVLSYLQQNHFLLPSYEDMLKLIKGRTIPELGDKNMTEEMLHKHSTFLLDQAANLTDFRDGQSLITLPCMKELSRIIKENSDACYKIKFKKGIKKSWTKATTTPLVRKTFESFFSNQLDKTNHDLVMRKKRCGICELCQLPDCGECRACKAMPKFGGQGRSKKACEKRLCPKMANEQAEESNSDNDANPQQIADEKQHDNIVDAVLIDQPAIERIIKWIGKPIKADASKVYYEKVEVNGLTLCNGDFVTVETARPNIPSLIGRIVYMWRETKHSKENCFHGEMFFRSSDTVLGEAGHPREVFLSDTCSHSAPLSAILKKAHVEKKEIPPDWFNIGGQEVKETPVDDDGETYFYSKYYERFTGRFEDLPITPECKNELRIHRFCPSCERKAIRNMHQIPKVNCKLEVKSPLIKDFKTEWSYVRWLGYDYKKGCAVFLKPGTFRLKNSLSNTTQINKLKKVDINVFTEYYRKMGNNILGPNIKTGKPFCVGYIAAVTAFGEGPLVIPQDIYLKVNVMYRPENTNQKNPQNEDLNVVYWSDEIVEVPFSTVKGPCDLIYEKNVPEQNSLHEWLDKDPSRLYFSYAYNIVTGQIVNVPSHATCVGMRAQNKEKEKGKGKCSLPVKVNAKDNKKEKVVTPLRTLDVFSGCGGLSEGLHRAGAANCRWAIENSEAAAEAYSLNYKDCCVFKEDCNELLIKILAGDTHSTSGFRLPTRGEVELLCGGPPCQGFSGMNRFNSRDYSKFKNSLVVSFLSYCDYYRPKYFILENVRNFVAYKRGMILKLTLRALLDMGYQCTFGVLQAGNFGVPQTRRRLIILAAAPGCVLPGYPEPTHVFNHHGCSLAVTTDRKRFYTNSRWDTSAPRRGCTIRDAMSDLPQIPNGANNIVIEYGSLPKTHYQRAARNRDAKAVLYNHICKNMSPLAQARICRIPTTPGSDWRDLPNISVKLSDGTKCNVLEYRYAVKSKDCSASGVLRGVCACAVGMPCSPQDKQDNTLIPWCLPHTGNRHNHWAGLYGRLSWDGYFSTTVTDPEPMGKQGRVLHPTQSRVVSVRECARSQGFPDGYIFVGTTLDKYRQIGNAVPPPLSAALGRELYKAMKANESV